MSCFTRCILRYGMVSGLALGGLTLWFGPHAVMSKMAQVRDKAHSVITDSDDPMVLRRQLAGLADEYPDRIAEVRGEIAEVDHQIGQFERDVDIARLVVADTTEDLKILKALVSRAESQIQSQIQTASHRSVVIRHDGMRFDLDEAYVEGKRINNDRNNYSDRLAHDRIGSRTTSSSSSSSPSRRPAWSRSSTSSRTTSAPTRPSSGSSIARSTRSSATIA